MIKQLTLGDIYNIRKYTNLDEGFKEVVPDYEPPHYISSRLETMKYNSERVEEWLKEQEGLLMEKELEYE